MKPKRSGVVNPDTRFVFEPSFLLSVVVVDIVVKGLDVREPDAHLRRKVQSRSSCSSISPNQGSVVHGITVGTTVLRCVNQKMMNYQLIPWCNHCLNVSQMYGLRK